MARKDIIDTSDSGKFRNLVTSKTVLLTKSSLEQDPVSSPEVYSVSSPAYKVIAPAISTVKEEVLIPKTEIYQGKLGDSAGSVVTSGDTDIKTDIGAGDSVTTDTEIGNEVVAEETSNWETVDETEAEAVSESGSFLGIGSGGGGGDSSGQEQSVVGGGFVQSATGITVLGWVYPYKFVLLTLGAGAIGLFIGYKFKKELLVKLALTAAGLMAGSALGMKTFPPVKKVQ